VPLVAISTDPSGESAKLARDYGIAFPLLSDPDAAVARQYTGVNYDDTAIPGVVIVKADGAIAFRQIAEAKDDRLTAAQVLAEVDRALGTTGVAALAHTTALDRTQLRLEAGGGSGGFHGGAAALVPLSRFGLVGPWLGAEPRFELDAALVLRLPLLHDTAAIELAGVAGSTPWRDANASARLGVWLAWTPAWAFHLAGGISDRDAFATVGVSRLLPMR